MQRLLHVQLKERCLPNALPWLWTLARAPRQALHRPPGFQGTDGASRQLVTTHLDAAQPAGADSDWCGGLGRSFVGLQRHLQLGGHPRGRHPHAPSIYVCSMDGLSIWCLAVLQCFFALWVTVSVQLRRQTLKSPRAALYGIV